MKMELGAGVSPLTNNDIAIGIYWQLLAYARGQQT